MTHRSVLATLSFAALAASSPALADCGADHAAFNPMQDASAAPAQKQVAATVAPKPNVKQDRRAGTRGGAKAPAKNAEDVAMVSEGKKER